MIRSWISRHLYLFVFVMLSCNLSGQKMKTEVLELSRLVNRLSRDSLQSYLTVLSADDMEGREVGHPGNLKAARYIAGKLSSFGYYSPVRTRHHLQYFPLYKQYWENIGMEISQYSFDHLEDFYALPSQNSNMPSFQANEIVYLGYGEVNDEHNDFFGLDLKNKIVLIEEEKASVSSNASRERAMQLNRKLEAAREVGVRAVFIVSDDFYNRLSRFKSILSSPSLSVELNNVSWTNVIYISPKVASRIIKGQENAIAEYRDAEPGKRNTEINPVVIRKPVSIQMHKITKNQYVPNVAGYLPGKDPILKNEVLVISAHLDHLGKQGDDIWNGADDDGSGVSAVLEIARVIGEAWEEDDLFPRRSLLILLANGEEKGLLGSSYYTDVSPLFPLESTIANLNIDMIGRRDRHHADDPYYVYVIGSDMLSTDLHRLNEAVNDQLTQLQLDYRYNDVNDPNRFYYRSDHYNFAKNNIPVIFYFTGVHEDYHQPTDTIEKIEFSKMLTITKLILGTAWELLNVDARPVVDKN